MNIKTNELTIRNKILDQNLKRLYYIPFVSIPINIGHILFFMMHRLAEPGTVQYSWGIGIIVSHLALIFIALCIWLLISWRKYLKKDQSRLTWLVLHVLAFLVVFTSVAIAVTDQLVTPAITPFITLNVIVAMLLLIRPRFSFILFGSAFMLFYFAISFTQHDPDILFSNRLNAMAIAGLCIIVSIILWRWSWASFEQSIIIDAQQKELETNNQELIKQAAILNDLNATKDKLFSIIAHDLKNPFSGIIGLSELLKEEARSLSTDEIENYASIVYNAANQAHELLENLLDWAKMQQGNMVFSPKNIKLKKLTCDILLLLNNNARQKNIILENEIAEDTIIEADEDMLKTILRNLLTNAIKFTNSGGIVKIFSLKTENGLQVTVKDNGTGISSTNISKLFKTGSNFNKYGTANEKGSGLGLVLCKEFVERHNGKILVESKEGEGSAFSFLIPYKKA